MNHRRFFILAALCALFMAGFSRLQAEGGLFQKSRKEESKDMAAAAAERLRIRKSGISAMTAFQYDYQFGKPAKKGIKLSTKFFDSRGSLSEEITYDPKTGEEASRVAYRYDRAGHIVEMSRYENSKMLRTITRYDSAGLRREDVSYTPDGAVDRKVMYIYDEHGNLADVRSFLADGRMFGREVFEYDSLGNIVANTNRLARFQYYYDTRENMIGIAHFIRNIGAPDTAAYDISERIQMAYDSLDNMTVMTVLRPDGSVRGSSQFRYNTDGRCVEETENGPTGSPVYRKKSLYDLRGRLVEEYGVDKGKQFRNIYRYDARGNRKQWIAYDEVDEPTRLTRYYFRSYSEHRTAVPELPGPAALRNLSDSSRIRGDEAFYEVLGCRIVAGDGVYLGLVWADTANTQSIVNYWGQYGFEGSPTSIFNATTPYGGLNGKYSPFNKSCQKPPILYRSGKFVSYLTDSQAFNPRISITALMPFLMELARGKSLAVPDSLRQ